jgi:hypothetical protein
LAFPRFPWFAQLLGQGPTYPLHVDRFLAQKHYKYHSNSGRGNYQTCFFWFFSFNIIFFNLQLFYILAQSNSFINTLTLPLSVYVELIATFGVHIGLYLLLSLIQTILFWGVAQSWSFNSKLIYHWQFAIGALSVCTLLLSNRFFFPLSLFSRVFFLSELSPLFLSSLLVSCLIMLALFIINALWRIVSLYRITIILLLIILILSVCPPLLPVPINLQTKNIILIGVDSLPPSAISIKSTPTIFQFIQTSVLFKETITPLARTFPAWTSILTGLYPYHHGARYNLMPPDFVKADKSIAWDLQQAGFETLFATDDRRFNNLNEAFGFQKIIGPKLGVNDFLIGTFNDFPLSNLLINTRLASAIFPYNYINRASHFVYYPQTFDNALTKTLRLRNQTKPLFLAVHFTLPHWPYAFASSTPAQVKDEYSVTEREQLFSTAIHQADNQVAHLLNSLKQYGYLNNSLIFLLSDHGEALYTKGSRQTRLENYQGPGGNKLADYFRRNTSTTLDKSAGHGSDLLSKEQYHCVLAGKIYQNNKPKHLIKEIKTRVALIDIHPTILAYLKLSKAHPTDGISLFNTMLNAISLPKRTFLMESGMLPNQFLSREQARFLGGKYFLVNKKTGQLQLKTSQLSILNAMKLFAIIRGDWVLAFYPDNDGYISVTQRLSDGAWTDELDSAFAQKARF